MLVYLVESGRDDPGFEALLSSKQAALDMLVRLAPKELDNDWRVRAIEVDGDVMGEAYWWRSLRVKPVGMWKIHDGLPE